MMRRTILALALLLAGCASSPGTARNAGSGASGPDETGGSSGTSGAGGVGGSSGAGGHAGAGGAGADAGSGGGGAGAIGGAAGAGDAAGQGGGDEADAATADTGAISAPDASAGDGDAGSGGMTGAGGAGGCPGDPRAGWTEFMDTFTVQHPYDLQVADRFTFQDGVYTLWVFPNDKPHAVGNTTAPRTEMRWSNWTTGERMWEADMMFESPLTHTCVMQIHNVGAAIAAYMQVNNGDMRNAAGGGTVLTNYYNKWFNMKVAFNPDTHTVRTWVNNCLIATTKAPNGPDPNWYFKNGVYTCNATICRDHFKNIRFWKH
jgi:hypothetical protein